MNTFFRVVMMLFHIVAVGAFAAEETATLVPPIPIEVLVQRPTLTSPRISPDGRNVAFVMTKDEKKYLALAVLTEDGLRLTRTLSPGEDDTVNPIKWVRNDRFLFSMTGNVKLRGTRQTARASMLYAVDSDGSNFTILRSDGRKPGKTLKHFNNADLIHVLPNDPQHILVGHSRTRDWVADYYDGVISDVFKMNVDTGDLALFMKAPKISKARMHDWYADHNGRVRFGYGEDRKGNSVMAIRGATDQDWKILSDNELFEEGKFAPLRFGASENEFYVLSSLATGRKAVFRFDIESGELKEKIFEHDEVDVSSIEYSFKKSKVVGAEFYTDRRNQVFFDKDYERHHLSMEQALKKNVYVVSKSRDENNLIVLARDETDPGAYYHYDIKKKKMFPLGQTRPWINPDLMAKYQSITFETGDGLSIGGYLIKPASYEEGKPVPTIVIPHGGPHSRFDKSFDYNVQFFASRGYAVFLPNVRGSTGWGTRFTSLGHGEWGQDMQRDLSDGARWLIKQGIAKPDGVCLVGWGRYAGYAALMGAIDDGETFACAATWAAEVDLEAMLRDYRSWDDDDWYYQRIVGDMKKKEVATISPYERFGDLERPIMIAHGEDDGSIEVKRVRRFAKRLARAKKVFTYYEFEEFGHTLDTEEEAKEFLSIVEAFMLEHNPTEEMRAWSGKDMVAKDVRKATKSGHQPSGLPRENSN